MVRKRRRRSHLWIGLPIVALGLPIVALGLGFVGAVVSDETDPPADVKVISPPDHAVLMSGNFDVICKTDAPADLEVNGKPQAWEPFEPPVRVARVRLGPGWHDLRIGGRRMGVVVALNEETHDGPADWEMYRTHTMDHDATRCGDCHETKRAGGRIAVGDLKDHKACFECHDSIDFDVAHSHPLEPFEPCEICHTMHGSTRKGLLNAPIKQLFYDCHES